MSVISLIANPTVVIDITETSVSRETYYTSVPVESFTFLFLSFFSQIVFYVFSGSSFNLALFTSMGHKNVNCEFQRTINEYLNSMCSA